MKNLIYSTQTLIITLVGFLTGDTRSTLFAFDIFSQKADLLALKMRQYRTKWTHQGRIAVLLFAVIATSCSLNKTKKGAIIGTTGGAAIGAVVGKANGNTVLGAIIPKKENRTPQYLGYFKVKYSDKIIFKNGPSIFH